jgi:hypothetical protein
MAVSMTTVVFWVVLIHKALQTQKKITFKIQFIRTVRVTRADKPLPDLGSLFQFSLGNGCAVVFRKPFRLSI